jgi:photosystem II stability/assembly factor-like uncharacterized protein
VTTRFYAATHEGVFVLEARGDACAVVARALDGAICDNVALCPATPGAAYAGDTHGGLYRTGDGGRSWRKVMDGNVRAIAVDPSDDRVVYAGTEPVRLYRSEDAGGHWEELTALQRLPEETREKLGLPQPDAASRKKFRQGRQEWSFPIPPHIGHVTEIFIRRENPGEIWLSIEHGGIARSMDRGQSWTDASAGIDYLDIHKFLRLPLGEDHYVVSSARGLYAAADPLSGWTRIQDGVERDYFHDMLVLPARNGGPPPVLVCTADGSPVRWPATKGDGVWHKDVPGSRCALYRSDDGARSWRRVGAGHGLPDEMGPMIWSLCAAPGDGGAIYAGAGEVGRGYAFGTAGKGAILRSDDGGESWRTLTSDLPAVRQLVAVSE